jgi:hypothetical protein
MTNIHELILNELANSKACHVDRFPPWYNFSVGAHLFNIHNKTTHTYFEARRIPDTRLHILFVAPPGGEKTFWQEQYLRGEQALLLDSGIEIGWTGTLTEAGFVGTIRFEEGESKTTPGLCMRKANAIVGIEEFAAVSEAMRAEYAKTLDPALLSALDSGFVYKDLAAGPLEYETHLTLWTGTQPARFDLRGGMGRRFLFIYFIPTVKDWKEITEARRRSKNMRYNPIQTDVIRKELPRLIQQLKTVERVEWDPDVYKFYDEMKFLPYEEQLYDRILIGYHVMTGHFDNTLYIKLDDYILTFLKKEAYYRDTIRRGSEFAEVLLILREHGGRLPLFELKDELLAFGKDWQQSAKLLDDLAHIRAIKRTPDNFVELSPQLREGS